MKSFRNLNKFQMRGKITVAGNICCLSLSLSLSLSILNYSFSLPMMQGSKQTRKSFGVSTNQQHISFCKSRVAKTRMKKTIQNPQLHFLIQIFHAKSTKSFLASFPHSFFQWEIKTFQKRLFVMGSHSNFETKNEQTITVLKNNDS